MGGRLPARSADQAVEAWVVAPLPQPIPHQTDWVCGASMIVRRKVFDAIGLLDENYFLYFEETDFCLRANGLAGSVGSYLTARSSTWKDRAPAQPAAGLACGLSLPFGGNRDNITIAKIMAAVTSAWLP